MPVFVFGQMDGTIKIRKSTVITPCKNCGANTIFTGTNGLKVRLDRRESFKKEDIKCYKINIFQNGALLTCFNALPDTVNSIPFISPGKYYLNANADNFTLSMKEIIISENKTTNVVFEFGEVEKKN